MPAASDDPIFDIAIIGGGINGCGIARDAAGRGASVYLCEMDDLASGTSSWSTKLIHGGLRYLEHYEFRLVREALSEREVLWRMAPHIVHPLRLILPYHKGLRPAWMLRIGLFLYDHLGARKLLPGTTTVNLATSALGAPLRREAFRTGFEYSDCRVDDARLVVLNAQDAAARGATIATRTKATAVKVEGGLWHMTVEDMANRQARTIRARTLINAAGPWVASFLSGVAGLKARARIRLVQGSHIVVPRIFTHDRAYIFQNADGRIIFAIPYEQDFTLIGTTDHDYEGDPALTHATESEITYLCAAASEYFEKPVKRDDVVWTYAGVRPLYDDGASEAQAATREYVFELDTPAPDLPLLSIFGGKITTYRRLAEEAIDKIAPFLPALTAKAPWTASAPLPGGDFPVEGIEALQTALQSRFPFIGSELAARYARTYGTRTMQVLGNCRSAEDMGRQFGAGLSQVEVEYLRSHEWAHTAADILWRRTKLGLHMTKSEIAVLEDYMGARSTI